MGGPFTRGFTTGYNMTGFQPEHVGAMRGCTVYWTKVQ